MTTQQHNRMHEARTLVEQLRQQQLDASASNNVDLLETHISWVLLSGDHAYKIKKPLDLGFLDFRTLEKRRFYCDEELRLNRHWAPELYLDVQPITRDHGKAQFGGKTPALEYAVRMRRFDQKRLLDSQLAANQLTKADLRDLARRVAGWHASAPCVAQEKRAQTLLRTRELILENFAPIETALDGDANTRAGTTSPIRALRAWTEKQVDALEGTIAARFDDGFFRQCHGDLHLGNLVRLDDGITPFDCIEFDEQLRDTDVVADYAFLLMDLVARDQTPLAAAFFNRYLEVSGDYAGVSVYNLYFVYRCLVRAKIAVFRAAGRSQQEERLTDLDEAHRYIDIALQQCAPRVPALIAMHGLTGAGKSFLAERIMTALPALRVRSDLERKRIAGLAETASSQSGLGTDLYDQATGDRVYERLLEIAGPMLRAGHDVILDAAFLAHGRRDGARALANRCDARFVLLDVPATAQEMRERVTKRGQKGDDPSEGSLQVLEHQLARQKPFTADERKDLVSCRSDEVDLNGLLSTLRGTS